MTNNSDYNNPRTNLFELLPETLKNDANQSFLENTVNRFLTKSELSTVVGTIGKKSTKFVKSTRINEPTVHRQGYQLQPLIHKKIATVDHITSYQDILNKAERLGVEKNRLPLWGNTEQFNFAPPVDFDKLVNWDKYFWYNPDNQHEKPQYITIKSSCSVATARYAEKQKHHNDLVARGPSPSETQSSYDHLVTESVIELSLLDNMKGCACSGTVGWDNAQWDDNPTDWWKNINPSPTMPLVTPANSLWYNTTTEELMVFSGGSWTAHTDSEFSTGLFPWDSVYNAACVQQKDDWSSQNKWLHQNDVPNIAIAIRAEMPIIEYNPAVELNEWSYVAQHWMYRKSTLTRWTISDATPTLYEMGTKFKVLNFVVGPAFGSSQLIVEGDHSTLTNGTAVRVSVEFTVSDTYFTVVSAPIYNQSTNSTTISVSESTNTLPNTGSTDISLTVLLNTTSMGDTWSGFHTHWALQSVDSPVPVNRQVEIVAPSYSTPITTSGQTVVLLPATTLTYQNSIRVYVNGKRTTGTYQEGWSTAGDDFIDSKSGDYETVSTLGAGFGNAIKFFDGMEIGTTVRVDFGPAAQVDAYLGQVVVRTTVEADDLPFTTKTLNLARYIKTEQQKTHHTQYPLFDIFHADGTTAYTANSIWTFMESPEYLVNQHTGKRIVITNQGKEFTFEQHLIGVDDELLCYRDGWSVTSSNSTGLQSIWRKDEDVDQYIPRFVNEYQLAAGDSYIGPDNSINVTQPLDESTGDWEVANQLVYNAHHENRREIKYSELVTHFNSIITAQTLPPEFSYVRSDYYRLLDKPNYSVGGTIHEYNDSYDTFISALFQTINTPRSLFDFAQQQYEYNLTLLKEYFTSDIVTLITTSSDSHVTDLVGSILSYIIGRFEQNDSLDAVFGDSTTYSTTTGKGVKNWIATMPFLGLAKPVKPILLNDDVLNIKKLIHHDGHVSDIQLPTTTIKAIHNQALFITNGVSGPLSSRPDWSTVKKGQFWKNTEPNDTNNGKLYKFNVVSLADAAPPNSHAIGVYWLKQSTGMLYERSTQHPSGWKAVTGVLGDIDAAWIEINIEDLLAQLLLEVEMRLYDCVPATTPVFNFNMLITSAEQATFVKYVKDQYLDYVTKFNENVNFTDFVTLDPFTWNYGAASQTLTIPTVRRDNRAPAWGSRWETIYKANFGTEYPHLMPWKLQGYANKPTWWDNIYKDVTGTRRWNDLMWTNITLGRGVLGQLLHDGTVANGTDGEFDGTNSRLVGYYFTCVDTTTDVLLPPYSAAHASMTFLHDFNAHISPIYSSLSNPYLFGEGGPTEHKWATSTDSLYGLLHIAFRMQPVKFLHHVMGVKFLDVAGLQVDSETHKVFSHKNTKFHGDLDDSNQMISIGGLNQWYVHFNRYNNIDSNTSDFRERWTGWETKLGYQTGSFINTKSLEVYNKYFSVIEHDYDVLVKKTLDMYDYWVDALFVTTLSTGSEWDVRYNNKIPKFNGRSWVFQLAVPAPINHPVRFYGVKSYRFTIDTDNTTGIVSNTTPLPWAVPLNQPIPGEDLLYNPDDTLTWFDGSPVQVMSTGVLPPPLTIDTTYYIIKGPNNTFQLASSYTNATLGIAIELSPLINNDTLFVVEVKSAFKATYGSIVDSTWKHIAIDKRVVNETAMPISVTGLESVINIIDGYSAYLQDAGWSFNEPEGAEVDLETGQLVGWQTEIERLINKVYTGLGSVTRFVNDPETDTFTAQYHEVNPFRNNIWFNNEHGIISNIYTGPYTDIRVDTTMYSQVGAPLPNNSMYIFRLDNKSRIRACALCGSEYAQSGYVNATDDETVNPYETEHLGGAHLFVDGYEHAIIFNNKTTEGYLLFDSFLGLSMSKFSLAFEKAPSLTFRPNIGGFYLSGTQMLQNIEHTVDNMRYYYDTYQVNETANFLEYARALLGYESPDYLDELNIGKKSKFIFWRGMIQNKGSVSAVKSFINARLFVDARVDEFWAYKVAEYGNVKSRTYNDLLIQPIDVRHNGLKIQFPTQSTVQDEQFTQILATDSSRWIHFPDQVRSINTNTNFYFDTTVTDVVEGFVYHNDHRVILVTPGDAVTVVASRQGVDTVLVDGQDYTRVNARIILLSDAYNTDNAIVTTYVHQANRAKYSPAKLIDQRTKQIVSEIMIWNPAVGHHDHRAMVEIDLMRSSDPAKYNTTEQLLEGSYDVQSYDPTKCWGANEVGMIWLNTNSFDYVPYYDDTLFTTSNDRLYYWGKAADWSTFDLYQWTESPVPPAEWVDYVTEQATNSQVDPHDKPSGIPMSVIYKRVNGAKTSSDFVTSDPIRMDVNPRSTTEVFFHGLNTPIYPTRFGFSQSPLPETGIPDRWSVSMYVNGLFMGDVTVRSVISSLLTSPPEDPAAGDIYIPSSTPTKSFWYKHTEEVIAWDGTKSQWYVVGNGVIISTTTDSPPDHVAHGDIYIPAFNAEGHTQDGGSPGWASWLANPNTLVMWDEFVGAWVKVGKGAVISSDLATVPDTMEGGDVYIPAQPDPNTKVWYDNHGIPIEWNGDTSSWDVIDDIRATALLTVKAYADISELQNYVPKEKDTITFVYDLFGQDPETASNNTITYSSSTPYTKIEQIDNSGAVIDTKYYFWVGKKSIRESSTTPSLIEVQRMLQSPSLPYMILHGHAHPEIINGANAPSRFTQVTVRGVSNMITESDRYKIRFQSVTSLRDETDIKDSLTKKNVHTQWEMFRQNQPFTIAEVLWNKLTESVLGYKLNNSLEQVPSLDRIVYDQTYGTETRIGMGDGQTFVDKDMAIATIIAEVENPNYDLYPIDKSLFLDTYNFDTKDSSKEAMEYIYNNFASSDINRIFFSCLHDALSLKKDYGGIMKTSAISLHGIRVLETADRVTDD